MRVAAAIASETSFAAAVETRPLKIRDLSAVKFFSLPTMITGMACLRYPVGLRAFHGAGTGLPGLLRCVPPGAMFPRAANGLSPPTLSTSIDRPPVMRLLEAVTTVPCRKAAVVEPPLCVTWLPCAMRSPATRTKHAGSGPPPASVFDETFAWSG